MKKSIVWGTCWFNESIEILVNFYNESLKSLKTLNYEVKPIIFSAKLNRSQEDIKQIKNSIPEVIILQNTTNIFPNKNYGVALITKIAKEKNIDYIAIVDSDWDIKENSSFVNNTVMKLIDGQYDIIIPNIGDASGRSNLLIGRTIIHLFYPDYKDLILTAFPGSLVCKTQKLYEIISDENYHYDWGGEWDIIAIAIKNNMNINSFPVQVDNVRHRPNNSKMQDSFQIWRAVLSNEDILKRYDNLEKSSIVIDNNDTLTKEIITKTSVSDFINILSRNDLNETQKQILYMIIYPLAFLIGEIKTIPIIEDYTNPYKKEEMKKYLNLALYCAKETLKNINIKEIYEKSKNVEGKYISSWNYQNQRKAFMNYKEV